MKKIFTLVLMVVVLVGCNSKKTPEELFNRMSSGVVVVLNEYYYEMQLPNGNSIFFTGISDDGQLENFTANEEEARKNRQVLTGTAFFINKEGLLMTNRHVADPVIDKVQARQSLINVLNTVKQLCYARMYELKDQYETLQAEKASCTYYDYYGYEQTDYDKLNEINQQQQLLQQEFEEVKGTADGIDDNIDPEGIHIKAVCELGIAYNNTFVTTDKDFLDKNPCVVVRTSDKEDVDLALIQLKNKKTPEDSYIFPSPGEDMKAETLGEKIAYLFKNNDKDKKLTIDETLYMIGYNAGLVLANTKQGIKVQMTSGKVTQLPDGQRLLYSIPTMQGSSGSPVIDERGRLVAVNFAKLTGTDNFNFGIPAERVKEFLLRK